MIGHGILHFQGGNVSGGTRNGGRCAVSTWGRGGMGRGSPEIRRNLMREIVDLDIGGGRRVWVIVKVNLKSILATNIFNHDFIYDDGN